MASRTPESGVDLAFAGFVRTGDPGDLARVFDETAPELLRLASHLVSDLGLAEDLVQSTFLVAMESCRDYAPRQPVLHWLTGILTNRAHELRRKNDRPKARWSFACFLRAPIGCPSPDPTRKSMSSPSR